MSSLKEFDSEIALLIENEVKRQNNKIELIASENFTSEAVLKAQGSVLTNKYAEGYPGKRYYGGCENVDVAEKLAISRAKELFSAEHANVQPHSGSNANIAVYFAALKPFDVVLSLDLAHGGHLTHGSPVNISGKYFKFVHYGVNPESNMLDYEEIRKLALEYKPKMIVAGASAYPRVIDFVRFKKICDEVNCLFMVDMAHIAGIVAAGLHPNPVSYADFVTTTTHKTLRGPRSGMILCKEKHAKTIDSAIFPGIQGGPLMHVIAAKAVALKEALKPEFKEYQSQIIKNAKVLSDSLNELGMNLVTGGTDNHLILIDLRNMKITGKDAEKILDDVGITVNKNSIPFETRSPMITSGIRIGTPAVTTRGMKEKEMKEIAKLICDTIRNKNNKKLLEKNKIFISKLCKKFPLQKIF